MWVRIPQVFLIVPKNDSIFKIPHELLLIKRLARRLGITFVIISTRKDIISQCDEINFFHFPSIKEAKSATWQSPADNGTKYFRKPRGIFAEAGKKNGTRVFQKKTSFYQKAGLIVAVIISFSVVVMVISPSATILIHPENTVQRTSIKFVSSSGGDDSVRREFVPAFPLTRVISEAIVIITSGSTIMTDGYATGTVRFENLTEDVVSIPSGTVVITTGEPPTDI